MEKDSTTVVRILRAAKAEFADKGLRGGRMEAIARRAGVNQALLYYYFNSKENLFNEVLDRVFSFYGKTDLTEFTRRYGLTHSQHLYAMLYFILMSHIDETDSEIDRMIVHAIELEGAKDNMTVFMDRDILNLFKRIADIIFMGISTGEFECDDPFLVILNLFYFIGFYGNDRSKITGTELYKHIYGDNYKNRSLTYLMGSVFKLLSPGDTECTIPVLPVSAKEELDGMIADFSIQWHKDWHDEISSNNVEAAE